MRCPYCEGEKTIYIGVQGELQIRQCANPEICNGLYFVVRGQIVGILYGAWQEQMVRKGRNKALA